MKIFNRFTMTLAGVLVCFFMVSYGVAQEQERPVQHLFEQRFEFEEEMDEPCSAEFYVHGKTAFVEGELDELAYYRLKEMFEKNSKVDTLVFGMVAGIEDDDFTLRAGRLIHGKGVTTVATSSSEIVSGGVDLFLAGRKRIVHEDAHVGMIIWEDEALMHKADRDTKRQSKKLQKNVQGEGSKAQHSASRYDKMYLDYYKAVGIDKSFYQFTMKKELEMEDDVYWLTRDELVKYKVATEFQSK